MGSEEGTNFERQNELNHQNPQYILEHCQVWHKAQKPQYILEHLAQGTKSPLALLFVSVPPVLSIVVFSNGLTPIRKTKNVH
jgi:hypothetical protein